MGNCWGYIEFKEAISIDMVYEEIKKISIKIFDGNIVVSLENDKYFRICHDLLNLQYTEEKCISIFDRLLLWPEGQKLLVENKGSSNFLKWVGHLILNDLTEKFDGVLYGKINEGKYSLKRFQTFKNYLNAIYKHYNGSGEDKKKIIQSLYKDEMSWWENDPRILDLLKKK